MRLIRWTAFTTLLLAAAVSAAPQESSVTVKVVNYAELGKIIRDLRGQVVLIDFWGIT
jgi:hypothetical protein